MHATTIDLPNAHDANHPNYHRSPTANNDANAHDDSNRNRDTIDANDGGAIPDSHY